MDAYRQEPAVSTLSANKKHCYACANVLDVRAELCPRCGVRQPMMGAPMMGHGAMPQPMMMQVMPSTALTTTSRNRVVAALLAFFLGGIGAHKFYLGRTGMGILYLVIFWTFIPALLSLIEGIILLAQSDESFARQYPG